MWEYWEPWCQSRSFLSSIGSPQSSGKLTQEQICTCLLPVLPCPSLYNVKLLLTGRSGADHCLSNCDQLWKGPHLGPETVALLAECLSRMHKALPWSVQTAENYWLSLSVVPPLTWWPKSQKQLWREGLNSMSLKTLSQSNNRNTTFVSINRSWCLSFSVKQGGMYLIQFISFRVDWFKLY